MPFKFNPLSGELDYYEINTGPQGAQGPQGIAGPQGDTGIQGPQGDDGTQGFQGAPGPQGTQGFQGDDGVQGPQGNDGAQGFQGAPGPQGDAGTNGAQGPQGDAGTNGAQGPQGDDGAQGPQGDSGVQGAQGATGVEVPVGGVVMWAGTKAAVPATYLYCNGSTVSRATFAALFAVIGVAFGEGDGSTTFHLPDLRGTFARGVDDGRGLDPDAAARTAAATGGNSGDNVGSVQSDQLDSHTHTQDAHTHTQNAHTHTQDAHTHTQNSHGHDIRLGDGGSGVLNNWTMGTVAQEAVAAAFTNYVPSSISSGRAAVVSGTTMEPFADTATPAILNSTATNQNATATNQNATATNQNTGGNETRPVNIGLFYIIRAS